MKTYFIKDDYQHRSKPVPYHDTPENALVYQVAVYQYAADIITKHNLATVLDIGCGTGLKLEKYIVPTGATITGIDDEQTIEYCTQKLEFGRWFVDDIENPYADLGIPADLIICADVIEHLIDPDKLFSYFKRWSHPKTHIIISTPERDLRRGDDDMGPPGNDAHIREWNQIELYNYLVSQHLQVVEHRIVELRANMYTCQLVHSMWENK